MAEEETRSDRLSAVEAQELDPSSLVGSYFLSDSTRGWQGCVVGEPDPGVYLVETFDWLVGQSHDQRLVSIDEMSEWSFYDSADWMRNAYEHGVQARWDRERQESGSSD